MSRRRFLAGMAAGTVAAGRAASAAPARDRGAGWPPAPGPVFKVGVLLPGSDIRPTLGASLLAGMRVALAEADRSASLPRIELVAADAGIGPARTIEAARRLLDEYRVAVLAGAATAAVATSLSALLEERRALLVVSDAGADAIEPARGGGSVFYDSLGYWQASWAMGRWAARNLGRRAVVAASFYESGYDSLYAFQRGLEEAGGEVVETCVTHIPPARHDIGRALAAIREARPDFAYAVYSGQPAVDFVRAYAASGLARRVPLAGSGFLTDETLLPAMGGAALGIRSCLSWGPDLPTPENRDFTAAFQRATGRQPDAFAVLGHETARLIGTALAAGAGDRGGLGSALATATFQAPRGRIAMSPTTHVTLVPLYLRETRRRHDLVGNEVVAELAPPSEARSIAILRAWPKTGWLNAYASA